MQYLTYKILFCQNEIACHFIKTPIANESLVILIPGGPCISAQYLDHFSYMLSNQYQINVGLLNLPNHDESILTVDKLPLSYQSCLELVSDALSEIQKYTSKLIIFGQSFGARLGFDLLASKNYINVAFLTGFPYQFQISSTLLKKIDTLELATDPKDDPDSVFQKNWKKLLPFYTTSSLTPEIFEALASNTKSLGNEKMLDNVSPIEISIATLQLKKEPFKIGILQGEDDIVVPDNNFTHLQLIAPFAEFFSVKHCGHFPMIEQPEKTLQAFLSFMNN